jgi:hypothetical protein
MSGGFLQWKLSKKNGRVIVDSNGDKIATAATRPNAPEAWSNARLMAAAPEMMAALESARYFIAEFSGPKSESLKGKIAAAIAKTEGK